MTFIPIHSVFTDGEDTAEATSGIPWHKIRVDLSANYDFVGWHLDIIADAGLNFTDFTSEPKASAYVGDFANLWIKPFKSDILKINLGKFNEDMFRGKFGTDGNMDAFTASPNKSPDWLFNRFQGKGGMLLTSSPVKGLTIGMLANSGFDINDSNGDPVDTWDKAQAEDVWKQVQIGAGYTVAGIGLARAQYIGATQNFTLNTTHTNPKLEAAFNFTMVENLNVDIGTKIPFAVIDDATGTDITYQDPFQVNLGAKYSFGDLGLEAVIYTAFAGGKTPDGGDISSDQGIKFEIRVIPSYYLAAADATVAVELNFAATSSNIVDGDEVDDSASSKFGAGLFLQKSAGKGFVKTGLLFTVNPEVKAGTYARKQFTTLTLPIVLEFSL